MLLAFTLLMDETAVALIGTLDMADKPVQHEIINIGIHIIKISRFTRVNRHTAGRDHRL
jgi:hypothetical protein